MQPRDPFEHNSQYRDGIERLRYGYLPVQPPRYSFGQTVVITLAGLAVGSFFAWAIVGVVCRLIVWAWS